MPKTNEGGISLEVKINKEIRNYTESMFFGLSMRQFFFAVFGIGVAVFIYFAFRKTLGTETLSWVCMLAAAPFAALGFITYNGMSAEEFAWVWLRSKFIEPQKVIFECDTLYHELISASCQKTKKEVKGKKNDEIA